MNDIMGNSGGKPPRAGFRLDKADGKVFGVCAGIGNYFGVDTMLVRVGFVLATLLGFGSPVLIYLAVALIAD
ncbi:PspC domain-containing protein [Porphyrobacter sp. ULC335]|jgi:phage shock protein C|uniref:PspC domain-containing protein n=1 Tax=Porphyrobacter sp. ULC335 TaxID=2854260 RepID=UPI00221E7B53|nr:PspC domain-containing protein [Porphyrobacter sp. ULC335]UYV15320.1 PspC domain-containing protein [Porphyrobacter sp. ULC335]